MYLARGICRTAFSGKVVGQPLKQCYRWTFVSWDQKDEAGFHSSPALVTSRSAVSAAAKKVQIGSANLHPDVVLGQVRKLFQEIKMKDLEQVPVPVFWFGVASLGPMCGPPVLALLTGVSPALTFLQVTFGATLCSFIGGLQLGHTIKEGKEITWERMAWNSLPQVLGWTAVILPVPLGALVAAKAFAVSAYYDLLYGNYPPWLRAFRLAFTVPAVIGLLLTFVGRIFF